MKNSDKFLLAIVAGVILLAGISILVVVTRPEPDYQNELAPSEVVKAWNDALRNGDVKTAAMLTSRTSGHGQDLGYFEQLSNRYQNFRVVERIIIHEEISGDAAVVIYRVQYASDATKYWMDKLFREDGSWKLAPQYVRSITLMEEKP